MEEQGKIMKEQNLGFDLCDIDPNAKSPTIIEDLLAAHKSQMNARRKALENA